MAKHTMRLPIQSKGIRQRYVDLIVNPQVKERIPEAYKDCEHDASDVQ